MKLTRKAIESIYDIADLICKNPEIGFLSNSAEVDIKVKQLPKGKEFNILQFLIFDKSSNLIGYAILSVLSPFNKWSIGKLIVSDAGGELVQIYEITITQDVFNSIKSTKTLPINFLKTAMFLWRTNGV